MQPDHKNLMRRSSEKSHTHLLKTKKKFIVLYPYSQNSHNKNQKTTKMLQTATKHSQELLPPPSFGKI